MLCCSKKENDMIKTKFRIVILTLLTLFLWYLPSMRQTYQVRMEQKEEKEQYMIELPKAEKQKRKRTEDKEMEKNESDREDPYLSRRIAFEKLQEENKDICAWILIPGTGLDMPVVCGKDDMYYLSHNAFREERIYGSIFAPSGTPENFSEQHSILYGHNMRDGSMFGGLKKYREESFWKENPWIYFYLPGEIWKCRIYSAQETDANSSVYRTGGWKKTDWDRWVEETMDSGCFRFEKIREIRKVLTLSTCVGDGSSSARLAVHASVEEIFRTDSGRKSRSVLE